MPREDDQEIDDPVDWDEEDVKAGYVLIFVVIIALICATITVAVMGYQKQPIIGWPLLGGAIFVVLRVVKGTLRSSVDEAKVSVDHAGNVFDDTTPESAVLEHRASRDQRLQSISVGWMTLFSGAIIYAIFITLFWYGIGRLIGWVVRLF